MNFAHIRQNSFEYCSEIMYFFLVYMNLACIRSPRAGAGHRSHYAMASELFGHLHSSPRYTYPKLTSEAQIIISWEISKNHEIESENQSLVRNNPPGV
jgi:hypothetical protein